MFGTETVADVRNRIAALEANQMELTASRVQNQERLAQEQKLAGERYLENGDESGVKTIAELATLSALVERALSISEAKLGSAWR